MAREHPPFANPGNATVDVIWTEVPCCGLSNIILNIVVNILYCYSCNISGPPDPPSDLDYNDGVVIESSVDLQWTRPSYTGGVDVTNYTVSANGRRLEVMDDSESVSYTTSGLVYGDVNVSAINTCGLESQPATINISAAGYLHVCSILTPAVN